jgi:hypothetical protein
MDFIDLSECVVSACGSYINCDLFLFVQTQNSSYCVKSQSTVMNLRSDVHCGSVHSLRLSVAAVNECVKYEFLRKYERSKKQNCIHYKIVIRFRYICFFQFLSQTPRIK